MLISSFLSFVDFEYNEALLYQLCDMGFPVDGCKKALYYTQNEGIDGAMNWVMEHMNDAGNFPLIRILLCW